MALYAKKVGRNTYYYLREMARVDGKPKMVSEGYIGSAADVAALLESREAQLLPERTPGTWRSATWPRRGGCWTSSASSR